MGVEVLPEAFVGGLVAEAAGERVVEAPVGVWASLASPEVGDGRLVEVLQGEIVGTGLGGDAETGQLASVDGDEEGVDDRPGRRRQKGVLATCKRWQPAVLVLGQDTTYVA